MYETVRIKDTLRVPPKVLGDKLDEAMLGIAQQDYEGIVDEDSGVVVAVTKVEREGEGKVVPGDGSVYYAVIIEMLAYKPLLQEVVEGDVSEITEFGAFIRTGPIEGLVHVSQIMDDYINYDAKTTSFAGKESKRKLIVGDAVMARTVSISLKGAIASSKIGYTMRQYGLGKADWKQKAKKEVPAKEKTKEKPKEAKK
jgi:DNA-directed RNA polymerase subunit E'